MIVENEGGGGDKSRLNNVQKNIGLGAGGLPLTWGQIINRADFYLQNTDYSEWWLSLKIFFQGC